MNDDLTAHLRVRAYELADTGRFADWDAIAEEMEREEIPDVLVRRIGSDAFFKVMIGNRIRAAQERR